MGGVLAMAGAVLPWWNVSVSVGGLISGNVPILGIFWIGGILALIFGVLGLVFSLLKSPAMGIAALVMGLLTLVVSVLYGVMVPTASVSAGGASGSITQGFGFWLSLVGGLVLMAGGPLVYLDNKKARTAMPMPTSPPMA